MKLALDSPAPLPRVSVIVVTYQRRDLIVRTLDALAKQTYPADLLEVVVVINGSTDGTAEDLEGAASVTVVRTDTNVWPAAARNIGAEASSGDILAFTDDDCRPTPAWVESLVAGFNPGVGLVQGPTTADPTMPIQPLSRTQWTLSEQGLYETCNVAYRREAFDRVGGFDVEFARQMELRVPAQFRGQAFGEDVDLGWRVRNAGFESRFASAALVHHHVFPPDAAYRRRRAALLTAFPLLVKRCPELRQTFLWSHFFLGAHRARFWLGLVGIVATAGTRRRAPVALGLPYVWYLVRPVDHGFGGRLKALPEMVLKDAHETAALVRGSIQTRTLVI